MYLLQPLLVVVLQTSLICLEILVSAIKLGYFQLKMEWYYWISWLVKPLLVQSWFQDWPDQLEDCWERFAIVQGVEVFHKNCLNWYVSCVQIHGWWLEEYLQEWIAHLVGTTDKCRVLEARTLFWFWYFEVWSQEIGDSSKDSFVLVFEFPRDFGPMVRIFRWRLYYPRRQFGLREEVPK